MKRKSMLALLLAVSMTCSMTAATGAVAFASDDTATEESADDATEETADDAEADEASDDTTEASDDDQKAADEVAALIDKIYVQERTDTTDDDCKAAKEAWDKLTDAQKELVEGEEASPEYFGRDTGDASKDDPRNQDEIGENELLVVSFGTSFNDSRAEDIKGIEDALAEAYPDWSVRRAFTAQIIINHVEARDNEVIDNMQQALDRAVDNGVKNLVVQPTHLMHGAEYDEMVEAIDGYKDKFESVAIAEPMLGEVGDDATVINDDKKAVAQAITDEACKEAGFDDMQAAADAGTAFVFMGHGTSHTANVTYDQMQTQMNDLGFTNAFIGTVEGEPEDTACEAVIEKVKEAGFKNVILRPLMVVAGDHANNDMAGDDEDSWKSQFEASGDFDSVDCQIAGLGRIEAVEDLYVEHTKAAIDSLGTSDEAATDDADAEAADDTKDEAAADDTQTEEAADDAAEADAE
ncbi:MULTISPECIES: sirohydrochlorin cobaltochelatase [unclassified Blautia]|uniref:sirohydrochlorin cobaltochelatase n=1 Tax=unclassified Blautia TaxID=2648079 RepID=UPI003F8A2F81